MYVLAVYIGGERVELFKDESVILNSSVQNVNDISKVFTDYTQSFTIPASSVNNKIFKHWYNADITGGFDSSIRAASTLELNYLPFKTGVIELESCQLKDGKVYSYKISFFSSLVTLSDLFSDDMLNDLDLSAYNHTYNGTNVKLGIEGAGLSSGDIIYPLISPVRNWLWDSATVDDIFYESATLPSTTNGIVFNELKPAIRLDNVINAIEAKYSVTFSTDFFTTTDFAKLFMWMSRDKGYISTPGVPATMSFSGSSSFAVLADGNRYTPGYPTETVEIDRYTVTVTPDAGYESVNYTIIIDDGVTPLEFDRTGTGTAQYELAFVSTTLSATIAFKIQSNESFSFSASLSEYQYEWVDISGSPLESQETTTARGTTGTLTSTGYIYCTNLLVDSVLQKGQMPNMKVSDFINSLFKMFNLVILPTSSTTFDVLTLDAWYALGSDIDITKYVDIENVNVKRPDLNRRITFNYVDGETILNQTYQDTNAVNYGDLEADFTYDGGELSISSGFENMLMERLSSQTDGMLSDTHVGKAIDDKLESVNVAPFVFYNKGITTLTTLTNALAFINEAGGRNEVLTYNNIGQENFLTNGAITNSLNFGSEISSWTLSAQTESLYSNYWQDYITDLYNTKRRIYSFNAIIPQHILTSISLNDKLIIRDRKYIVNKINANLTNGKVKLELLNDV